MPFLAVAALVLALMASDDGRPAAQGFGQRVDSALSGDAPNGLDEISPESAGPAGVGAPDGFAGPGASATAPAGSQQTQTPGRGTRGVEGTQQLDALGRPLTGDKGKCAPGGLLQENVTRLAFPCTPKFAGDNGGATWKGVSAAEVTAVFYLGKDDPASDALLGSAGVAASPEEYREMFEIYTAWFNKHYEFYGRKIKWTVFIGDCPQTSPDLACQLADMKVMIEKHRPFMVIYRLQGNAPIQIVDYLARQGIISTLNPYLPRTAFRKYAPYAWQYYADLSLGSAMGADYYCKKMVGKPAKHAGDPALRTQRRKVAIPTSEDAISVEEANRFKKLITGGHCGAPADAIVYTYPSDPAKFANDLPTIITRMKNDGVTTVYRGVDSRFHNEASKQRWFPEWFLNDTTGGDHDLIGRLSTPDQSNNMFGVSWEYKFTRDEDKDDHRVVREMAPNRAPPPVIFQHTFRITRHLTFLVQQAGPRLTPETFRRGAFTAPQVGGWVNERAWPGWKCCNAELPEYKHLENDEVSAEFGPSYGWQRDAKEVHYSSSATSEWDGNPGAFQCADDCRRYRVGRWPAGEPF